MTKPQDAAWSMSDIYLENRYETPKETFRMTLEMIQAHFSQRAVRVLDVGTAEAALPYFLMKHRPNDTYEAVEYDPMLVERAQKQVPGCKTVQGSSENLAPFRDESFDVVTCHGVLSIFDDYRPTMKELLRVAAPGGLVLVNNMWNAFPIDLMIKVRHPKPGPQNDYEGWEAGWNMVSLKTISAFLGHHQKVQEFDFTKVQLPVDLAPRPENLLRSWTQFSAEGERYHMNGIGRVLDKRVLRVFIKKTE